MTGPGPRISWALADEVLAVLERHGFPRPPGQLPGQVVTLVQALAAACTAPPDQPGPPRPATPGGPPGGPPPDSSGGFPPGLACETGRVLAAWDRDRPAGWPGGEPASVRAAWDARQTAGETGPPAAGLEVDV